MTDWVSKAGKAKIQAKAQAIVDATDKALWESAPRFNSEHRVAHAVLLEAINQAQNGQGMICSSDLHLIAEAIKTL